MGVIETLSNRRLYLDTNVFIYFLNGFGPFASALAEIFSRIDGGTLQARTSELALAEILVQPFKRANEVEERRCREALRPRAGLCVHPVNWAVLEETARLRARLPSLRTPDAIHLATALLSECDAMLTNDRRLTGHFVVPIIPLSSLAVHPPTPAPDPSQPEL